MEAKLAEFSTLSQKDKGPAFISLIPQILSQSDDAVARDLHTLVDTVVNQESVGLVVGRQVLSELVRILPEGAIKDTDLRKRVVEETLAIVQPRIVSYEEQVVTRTDTYCIYLSFDIPSSNRSTASVSNWQICSRRRKTGAALQKF